jgi:hypothetical protein
VWAESGQAGEPGSRIPEDFPVGSGPEQRLDGATLIHGAIPLGDLLERQGQVEDLVTETSLSLEYETEIRSSARDREFWDAMTAGDAEWPTDLSAAKDLYGTMGPAATHSALLSRPHSSEEEVGRAGGAFRHGAAVPSGARGGP